MNYLGTFGLSRNYTKHFRLHLYFLKDIYGFSHNDKAITYAVPDDFEIATNCFAVLSSHTEKLYSLPGFTYGFDEIDTELTVTIPAQFEQYNIIYPGFVVSHLADSNQEASPFLGKLQAMYTKLAGLKLYGLSYLD